MMPAARADCQEMPSDGYASFFGPFPALPFTEKPPLAASGYTLGAT